MLLFVCFMSWCVLQVALSCIYNAAAIKSECCGIGLSEEFKKLIGALPTYSGPWLCIEILMWLMIMIPTAKHENFIERFKQKLYGKLSASTSAPRLDSLKMSKIICSKELSVLNQQAGVYIGHWQTLLHHPPAPKSLAPNVLCVAFCLCVELQCATFGVPSCVFVVQHVYCVFEAVLMKCCMKCAFRCRSAV